MKKLAFVITGVICAVNYHLGLKYLFVITENSLYTILLSPSFALFTSYLKLEKKIFHPLQGINFTNIIYKQLFTKSAKKTVTLSNFLHFWDLHA